MLPKLHLAPNHVSFLLKQFALVVGISPSCTVQRTLELTLTKAPVLCPHGCQGSETNTNNNRSNSKGNFSLGERIRWKHSKKWIRSTIWNNCFHASWIPPYMCNDVEWQTISFIVHVLILCFLIWFFFLTVVFRYISLKSLYTLSQSCSRLDDRVLSLMLFSFL